MSITLRISGDLLGYFSDECFYPLNKNKKRKACGRRGGSTCFCLCFPKEHIPYTAKLHPPLGLKTQWAYRYPSS